MWEWPKISRSVVGNRRSARSSRRLAPPVSWTTVTRRPSSVDVCGFGQLRADVGDRRCCPRRRSAECVAACRRSSRSTADPVAGVHDHVGRGRPRPTPRGAGRGRAWVRGCRRAAAGARRPACHGGSDAASTSSTGLAVRERASVSPVMRPQPTQREASASQRGVTVVVGADPDRELDQRLAARRALVGVRETSSARALSTRSVTWAQATHRRRATPSRGSAWT